MSFDFYSWYSRTAGAIERRWHFPLCNFILFWPLMHIDRSTSRQPRCSGMRNYRRSATAACARSKPTSLPGKTTFDIIRGCYPHLSSTRRKAGSSKISKCRKNNKLINNLIDIYIYTCTISRAIFWREKWKLEVGGQSEGTRDEYEWREERGRRWRGREPIGWRVGSFPLPLLQPLPPPRSVPARLRR